MPMGGSDRSMVNADLLELLRCMIAGEKSADELLAQTILSDLEDIAVTHPEGMASIPEALTRTDFECEMLTKSIACKNLHYFIPGEQGVFVNSRYLKRIIVWLVYERAESEVDELAVKWSRHLFSAERGMKDNVAAIYASPYILDPTHLALRDPRWILRQPGGTAHIPAMDGKPRSHSAAPLAVESKAVGCFVDSTKDGANRRSKVENLCREWIPKWRNLSNTRTVGKPVDATMVLLLKGPVDLYEELIYTYDWKDYEDRQNSSGRGQGEAVSTSSSRR